MIQLLITGFLVTITLSESPKYVVACVTADLPERFSDFVLPGERLHVTQAKVRLRLTNAKREGKSGNARTADDFHILVIFLFVLVGATGFTARFPGGV